jgi:hypothetical protein
MPNFSRTPDITEIDLANPLDVIRSPDAIDLIVGKVALAVRLVEFTSADRSPVWVNAAMVGDVRPCPRRDAGGARTIFGIGGIRQAVCQAHEAVVAEVARALA